MDMDLKNMTSYKDIVEMEATRKKNHQFKNGGIEHANIVLTAMINHAEKEVLIYDKDISGDISEEDESFFMALYSNVKDKKIKIVVDDAKQNTRLYKAIRSLNKKFPNNIFLAQATTEFKKFALSVFNKEINFAVADGMMYRYEEIHPADARQFKALCNFNDPIQASSFKKIFDDCFDACPSLIAA